MRKVIGILFSVLLITAQVQADNLSITGKLIEMDESSKTTFGVSLAALAYLFDVRENRYVPDFHLKKTGQMKLIHELENAGYIKVDYQVGLPNGKEPNTTFLKFVLLDQGNEIQQYILK